MFRVHFRIICIQYTYTLTSHIQIFHLNEILHSSNNCMLLELYNLYVPVPCLMFIGILVPLQSTLIHMPFIYLNLSVFMFNELLLLNLCVCKRYLIVYSNSAIMFIIAILTQMYSVYTLKVWYYLGCVQLFSIQQPSTNYFIKRSTKSKLATIKY